MRRTSLLSAGVAVAASATLTVVALPAAATPAQAPPPGPAPSVRAAVAADNIVDSAAAAATLRLGAADELHRTGVVAGTRGLQYVTYARTYRGLPVVGGDVVVTTDVTGSVRGTAVARTAVIGVGTTAAVTAAAAARTARAQLVTVDETSTPTLAVLAGPTPTLVWQTVVTGRAATNRSSVLHVFVDARSGKVVETRDDVRAGTGNGYYYGSVAITTSRSGASFSMTDTTRTGLKCGGQNGAAYTGADDSWGDGSGTSLETACVDALYAAQQQSDMLRAWLGRNAVSGTGRTPAIRVGLADVQALWNGSFVNFGHTKVKDRQVTAIDVVAHELGHAIFQTTPGGVGSSNENGGINEATGDIFGALTEAYANNPLDPPDYSVGEEVDIFGDGPTRYMYNPSLAGDPNCWSPAIASTEAHAAAGPLNHWFYLTAEGSAPAGKPASPTCNSSTVTGVGIRKAGEIYYNALLTKTSTWKHADIRVATLNAAKNLHPGSCTEFDTVKAAWAAVSVPARSGEPTCSTSSNDFSVSASPASGNLVAGASTTVSVPTATTAGSPQTVALAASGLPAGATATFRPASVSSGSSSTLTIATSASTPAGSYPLTITGTGATTRTATYALTVTGGSGGGCTGTNGTALTIPDAGAAVTSTVGIGGCARTAVATAKVAVSIAHPFRGDLVIDLVAPDGSAYRLKNSSSADSADDIDTTYSANVSSEAPNGRWKLKVQDVRRRDTGRLDTWTLTL
nr:zinc metalloprotease [uncultured bacterium]